MRSPQEYNNKILRFLDPHRQSPFAIDWTWKHLFLLGALTIIFFYLREASFFNFLFRNVFIYFPNYLVHEFSHRIVDNICTLFLLASEPCSGSYQACHPVLSWLITIAGNGGEWLVPLLLIFLSLRLQGGSFFLPVLLYWSASTWYDAAIYVSDARACKLALTSSDMMTNYAPGEVKGDWYYILKPLGLLEYDISIGYVFFFIGMLLWTLALFSAWHYWHRISGPKTSHSVASGSYSTLKFTPKDYEEDPFAHLLPQNPPAPAEDPQDVNTSYPRSPNEPPL